MLRTEFLHASLGVKVSNVPFPSVTLVLVTTSDVTRPIRGRAGHDIKMTHRLAIIWAEHIANQRVEFWSPSWRDLHENSFQLR